MNNKTGPWWKEAEFKNTIQIVAGDGQGIVALARGHDAENANDIANIICAAPDLLEACEDALHHHIEFGGLHLDTVLKLKAAIEKAKGI